MSAVRVIAGYALQEAVRRRVFSVVLWLTTLFMALYGLALWQVFKRVADIHPPNGIEPRPFAGATVFGLSMFATMFLGVVLGVFLTLGVVGGDAERGLLQPLLVRPVSRTQLLLGRLVAAVAVCTVYVACVYTILLLMTGLIGGWWPDRIALPAVELAAGVATVAALSLLGSVFLSATANGIAVFIVFGAGLVAGLLGSIGEALGSGTLKTAAHVASWALPFEALYQDGLAKITEHTAGFASFILKLGPFGGAHAAGPLLGVWIAGYVLVVSALALAGFTRRDL
ncbi:MAG: ABC transporter permease [Actinobacteria bacterium]|nr:ABC transporter permease [Actinomycetota bacterium]